MEDTEKDASLDSPFILNVKLNRNSAEPLYQQILMPISQLIKSGKLKPNQLLEDEISMAHRLDISRPTARRALQELVDSGLLVRRRGVELASPLPTFTDNSHSPRSTMICSKQVTALVPKS